MRKTILLLTFCTVVCKISIGQIIDVHMHSYIEKNFWVGTARNGLASSKTAKETLEETVSFPKVRPVNLELTSDLLTLNLTHYAKEEIQ